MEPIQTSQNNRAVVLAGGGARGAYQIGVWRALREMEIPFSIVTGTSVGALNGAFMVQGDYEFAKSMWESINAGQVLDIPGFDESWQETPANSLHFFLSNILRQGGADPRPLEELLRQSWMSRRFWHPRCASPFLRWNIRALPPVSWIKRRFPRAAWWTI